MISCENLVKIYKTKELEVLALQGLELNVDDGEMIAIIGNSGSGKSTLLNLLGGLDKPSAGTLLVDGDDLFKMNEKELVRYKRNTVGFVWQNNARNLIPYLSARENVELPMNLRGRHSKKRALELLELVQMSHRKDNRLFELSGGEQQRVAIALSLANEPKLLLADEPTGAVDTNTANHLIEVFRDINKAYGTTIVIVTHDRHLAGMVDRVVEIRDGRTSSEYLRRSASYSEKLAEILEESTTYNSTHEKYVIVDNAGRLQIPEEMLHAAGINGRSRVVVEYKDDKIVVSTDNQTEQHS